MPYRLVLAAVLGLAILTAAAPGAAAIETTTFGLDVVDPTADGRLHIPIKAGETSSGQLRLFNKTDGPLTIALSVSPAQVDGEGSASLGGDATAVAWVELSEVQVALAPREERTIDVRVQAPRQLPAERAVVAIVAEPQAAGDAPAVVQRVAVTTLLEPDKGSLVASLGWYPWLAALLLAIVVALTLFRARYATPRL